MATVVWLGSVLLAWGALFQDVLNDSDTRPPERCH